MKRRCLPVFIAASFVVAGLGATAETTETTKTAEVVVGSKKFTESVILGEILRGLAESESGASVVHRDQLGGTRILWKAVRGGEIDAYPDYTGTLEQEIFHRRDVDGLEELRAAVGEEGLGLTDPLGFDNTYALGMKKERAAELGIGTISDLRHHPELRFGFTNEFMDRQDGWPGLRSAYDLPQRDVRGLDHDLAYRGLESGTLDVIDLYSTDAEIRYYDLEVLEDDAGYFPDYEAVIVYRLDLDPGVIRAFRGLGGRITAEEMVAMNAAAKIERTPEGEVAADFLEEKVGVAMAVEEESRWQRFALRTKEHLVLVAVSLGAAILLAVPAGIVASRRRRIGQVLLGIAGILQTIPSLALLVFMIPLLGIGGPPAMMALYLYSLLPILRNTATGLDTIPDALRESAESLGLGPWTRLRRVELPMAAPHILSGIKIAAVINIGVATLGALIGAGGYGQPILTGIRLDDLGLILEGAVPAAGLALLAQGFFELLEQWIVPEGLRAGRE